MANDVLDRRVCKAGQVIFEEGESESRCAYIVESGRVEIVKRTADGGSRVLGQIEPGGIFGEMALIDNQPRMASALAVEATTLITVNEASYEQRLKKADPFIRSLLAIFVRNIRETTDRLVQL